MNIMQMMKQAQSLQKKLKETQDELGTLEVTGEAANGAVVVKCSGQGRILSVKINPEAVDPENPANVDTEMLETLEDLITAAISKANDNAAKLMESKMKEVTGGINIPGLNF